MSESALKEHQRVAYVRRLSFKSIKMRQAALKAGFMSDALCISFKYVESGCELPFKLGILYNYIQCTSPIYRYYLSSKSACLFFTRRWSFLRNYMKFHDLGLFHHGITRRRKRWHPSAVNIPVIR